MTSVGFPLASSTLGYYFFYRHHGEQSQPCPTLPTSLGEKVPALPYTAHPLVRRHPAVMSQRSSRARHGALPCPQHHMTIVLHKPLKSLMQQLVDVLCHKAQKENLAIQRNTSSDWRQ